jgi:hypothetical protein
MASGDGIAAEIGRTGLHSRLACVQRAKGACSLESRSADFHFLYCVRTRLRQPRYRDGEPNVKKIEKAGLARNAGQKLKLSRETLRRLEAAQLEDVVGGTIVTCAGEACQVSQTDCGTKVAG